MVPDAKDMFADDEARAQTALLNAHIQVRYFTPAVRAVGLDAGPMGGFDRAAVDAEFFAGTPLHSILVVNIGHVAEGGNYPRMPHVEWADCVTVL